MIISVDPGVTGSFAVFEIIDKIDLVDFVSIKHCPDWENVLHTRAKFCTAAYVESVHAFPGQGVSSMFTFGQCYGSILTALTLAECSIETVQPQAWQRRCGLPHRAEIEGKSQRRQEIRRDQKALALKLFPQLASAKGDVYASVLIGYAVALDILHVPQGQLI